MFGRRRFRRRSGRRFRVRRRLGMRRLMSRVVHYVNITPTNVAFGVTGSGDIIKANDSPTTTTVCTALGTACQCENNKIIRGRLKLKITAPATAGTFSVLLLKVSGYGSGV